VVLNGHPIERLPNTLNVSFVAQLVRRFWGACPEWPHLQVPRAMPDRWDCPQSCEPWESHLRSEWARFGSVSAVQRPEARLKL